jgi:bifunctional DNA primase/polymerase-like protein
MARDTDPNREVALKLGDAGISVFPCTADPKSPKFKKPLVRWRALSCADEDAILRWWHEFPGALPGIDLQKAELLVLDGDRHGHDDGVTALRELLKQQPDFDGRAAPCTRTPNDGIHIFLAQNGHELTNRRGGLPDGIDVRGVGGFVIAPCAVLPDGRHYHPVAGKPDLIEAYRAGTVPFVPQGIVDLIQARRKPRKPADAGASDAGEREKAYARAALDGCAEELAATAKGKRNEALNALAFRLGRMVGAGWIERTKVEAALTAAMHTNGYAADKGDEAVEATLASGLDAGIADPHGGLDQDEPRPKPEPPPKQTLADVHRVFRKWLGSDYDIDMIDATVAAAASEKLSGDPLWLLIVAGPGGAKTETVSSLAGAGAHVTSTITSEGALLSASPRRERNKSATGGLLRRIGDHGILVIKDFTSILSADRNTRAAVLAAVREIYDGRWERNVGTDGGQTLTWTGRIVIVGAVTTAWDAAHSVVATMGDRFVLLRPRTGAGRRRAGLGAIHNTGDERTMREELAAAVGGLISHMEATAYDLNPAEVERLLKAADVVTLARSAVERDYRGDVLFAHDPEMPTRFAKQLVQMLRGAIAVGMTPKDGMRLALRCAQDSIPPLRRDILLDVAANPDTLATDVRKRISKPSRTVRRELECLHMLGVLRCDETQETDREGKERTIWRYRLADDFDAETLGTMGPMGGAPSEGGRKCE